jgi:hypothetical protein
MHDTYDEQHWHLATADGMREPENVEDPRTTPVVAGAAAAEPAVH